MKNTLLLLALILTCYLHAQEKFETPDGIKWTRNWTSFDPNNEPYGESEEIISNIIDTDMTLDGNTTYLMSGNVYITNDATLTIEPGAVIRCETTSKTNLIVTKGAKLIAEGNMGRPIVFTSNKPVKARRAGDWGGITIIGSGKIN